jgi:hypothetical protein
MKANRITLAICFIALMCAVSIIAVECNHPKTIPAPDSLRTVITKLKTITYHDTITQVKTKYRIITDSVRFNDYDTSWHILKRYADLCDSVHEPISDAELQSLVSRRLIGYCECRELNGIYQNRRTTDSLIIANYTLLDDISQAKLSQCITEQGKTVKAAAKNNKRKKLWKLVSIGLGGLILIK